MARGPAQTLPGIDRVTRYVQANPTVLSSASLAYPDPSDKRAGTAQVLLVGTTGDLEDARRVVRRWYAGPLCVRTVPHSRAQLLAARAGILRVVEGASESVRYGIYGGAGMGSVGGDPRTSIDVVVYDELVHALRTAAGADLVEVGPQWRKLR